MGRFYFLTNHARVLNILARQSLITAREVSLEIGITERAVRKIIGDLETEGYIVKEKKGRRLRYKIKYRMPMRHKTQRDKGIGSLLKVLS
jgi:predicted ArsR family transcriptional regulator